MFCICLWQFGSLFRLDKTFLFEKCLLFLCSKYFRRNYSRILLSILILRGLSQTILEKYCAPQEFIHNHESFSFFFFFSAMCIKVGFFLRFEQVADYILACLTFSR